MKSLKELTRPNIWALEPYSSARDEYSGKQATVFLDANENPYNTPINRYPDPRQTVLKQAIGKIKGICPDNLFLGNGSDEAIDLVYRAFCEPAIDNVVAIEPTYGMYSVCAAVNNVEYRRVMLDSSFNFNAQSMLDAADSHTKMMWLCSPNNPTGNVMSKKEIVKLVTSFDGLVILDEAYNDFSGYSSFIHELTKYPNLIVLQTFSKAMGCAAIRLGMAYASKDIINIMSKIKYPYNVNQLTQNEALKMLERNYEVEEWVKNILAARGTLMKNFAALPVTVKVYPTNANFFLAKMTDANNIYNYLVDNGIIIRNRSNVTLCNQCFRVTVGTTHENNTLIEALKAYKA